MTRSLSLERYAAAWFTHKSTALQTRFGDSLGMEYHDYNLFHEGGHGRPRVPMKPNNPFDFWVDHLSGFEHIQQQKNQAKIATTFDTDKARSWTESETARQIDVAVRRQATSIWRCLLYTSPSPRD